MTNQNENTISPKKREAKDKHLKIRISEKQKRHLREHALKVGVRQSVLLRNFIDQLGN
ncbi:MAG: hypothetical protein VB108_01305 [Anaerolineaceae bacterium]|nr:hypothetical protein [Anaerolineaceae bacterium]